MTDDELLARLRAADPAASLPPADPSRVARLLEDTMTDDLPTESRATGTHGRGPLTWLLAAAAVLIIAGVGVFGVTMFGGDEGGVAPRAVDQPSATELRAPAASAYAARCMPPSARTIGNQTVAFEGTVDEVGDGLVLLTPTRWYHGTPTDRVTIEAPAAELADLVGAARFQAGRSYLVSATRGQVTVCGLTAPYSDELAALYAEAFPG